MAPQRRLRWPTDKLAHMRSRATTVLLLLALLWQSMASAAPAWTSLSTQGLEHAAMHWLQEGHHHHDDGSYERDDSSDSMRHVTADVSPPVLGLLSEGWSVTTANGSASPVLTEDLFRPPPFVDGPHRPPRPSS
jgi:hypothetical protein